MKFCIYNLGCKVNAYEAESISEELIKENWERVDEESAADAVLIFTCAVTNTAAAKSRKVLHKAKRLNDKAVTVVAGCYAQINDGMLDGADILVGSAHKKDIPLYLNQFLKDGKKIRALENLDHAEFENLPADHFENHSRGVLKIQDGCNQFCAYCIIPYARGRERSLAPDLVIAEAKKIAERHSEIVLTGIHTGRYGREYGVTLTQLLERILEEVPSIKRLRISSIEVTELSDEFIALMKREKRIARHLHIPLQAGCDKTLKNMGRPYDTAAYYDKIERIRREIPDVAISCDIMVGFPSESDADFEESYAFLKKCRFSFLHVFPFSLREGTRAADMPCQIDPAVKKERAAKCIALSRELEKDYWQSWIGKDAEVISEKVHDGYTPGYTSQYIPVRMEGIELPRGSFVKVKMSRYSEEAVFAEMRQSHEII